MHIPVILFSYRKLRLLYEKALRAKDAQLRARNTTKCPLGKAVLPRLFIAECAKHTFVLIIVGRSGTPPAQVQYKEGRAGSA